MTYHQYSIKVLRTLAVSGTIVAVGAHIAPHATPFKMVPQIPGVWINNASDKHYELLKDVCRTMKLEPEKIQVSFNNEFNTFGVGCFQFPQPKNRPSAVICLPRYFMFNPEEDMSNIFISIGEQPIDWSSECGKQLREAFFVSNEHLKFSMAHELAHIRDRHFIPAMLHSAGFCLVTYKAMVSMTTYYNYSVPRAVRAQVILLSAAVLMFLKTRQKLLQWFEHDADKSAAMLGAS